ncbi:MAG: SOS response-associated peptidase family protein [Microterricola sp.]
MCASYGLETTPDELDEHFAFDERGRNAAVVEWLAANATEVVKPTGPRALNLNPLVRERVIGGESVRQLDLAWWQMWIGGQRPKFSTINARSENLLKGAWAGPTMSRRALVPVTHYFEKGRRFDLGGELFSLAAIYTINRTDAAPTPDGWLPTYAIVTRPAASHVEEVHDRMPLIIAPEMYADWLAPDLAGDRTLVDAALAASDGPSQSVQMHDAEAS